MGCYFDFPHPLVAGHMPCHPSATNSEQAERTRETIAHLSNSTAQRCSLKLETWSLGRGSLSNDATKDSQWRCGIKPLRGTIHLGAEVLDVVVVLKGGQLWPCHSQQVSPYLLHVKLCRAFQAEPGVGGAESRLVPRSHAMAIFSTAHYLVSLFF